jgi:putative exosortase-associated protein (TIGR04073 family)
MRRLSGAVLLAGFTAFAGLKAQPAFAARTPAHEAAESQDYGRKFGGMIGRGLLNAATCFVDVIVNVVNETKSGPALVGTLTGVAKGTGCGALRLGSGAVDLVTFWVPGFNGFPVSDSYENCFAVSPPSVSVQEPTTVYTSPTSSWETPTTEPGAAQAPIQAKTAKKKWTK